ncbi:TrbC/VirB2 family protein [Wolbachia endosymbiont of Folsomia candida]|uniref:TrbC/VirB2 family protein n=1 Tax=Wolbachia endosymbiont of Folsomia candida TaxID=169402 RepID=UPI000B5FC328|nr:TrbC/VirB2 family protein [Wolbachia endosymbiont of Folsomia candida]APR99160.1 hypothetical protein ASM33_01965 [Wolbachia endosymbiont of Folsomia candida]
MSSIMKKIFSVFCVVLLFSFSSYADTAPSNPKATPQVVMDDTTQVICNIIGYIWGLGGPLMTVIFIGAALMAIFGRMPWPALFALGMFCGVFFGAKSIIIKVMPNVSDEAKAMLQQCGRK